MRSVTLFCLLLSGLLTQLSCESTPARASAWWTVEAAFKKLVEGKDDAQNYFTEIAYTQTTQLRRDQDRYRFLHIEQLRFSGTNIREGAVTLSLDQWPISFSFQLRRTEAGWTITSIGPQETHARARALLGQHGLPKVAYAPEWSGGLNGRDAEGRPHSAVLVTVLGGQVSVDGGETISYRESAVKKAINDGIERRRRLSKRAKATYRPHVALGLRRQSPVLMTLDLIDWAFDAGAQSIQVIVRGKDGLPSSFSLGRVVDRPLIDPRRPHINVNWGNEILSARMAGQDSDIFQGQTTALSSMATALRALPAVKGGATMLLRITPAKTHGAVTDHLSALYNAVPGLHVALEGVE